MPRGRTASTLSLQQRRETAMRRFLQGYTNTDIAREIGVTDETVARYRAEYEDQIRTQARERPDLLIRVVDNTILTLQELELVRQTTWEEYQECESANTRTSLLNTLVKIGQQKAQLFGLFGVRQEYFLHVQKTERFQQALLEWMRRELCAEDRNKLEAFITQAARDFFGEDHTTPAIEATALPGPQDDVPSPEEPPARRTRRR
jgi:transposase-like protein